MTPRLLRLAALSVTALLVAPAWSAVNAPAVLRVGTTGDYPPFSYRDPASGRWIGADIEAAQALGRSLGRPVQFITTTWSALLQDQVAGRFDIAMGGISITAARLREADYSVAYLQDGKTALTRCADAYRLGSLAALDRPEVRVIENPGGTNERFARQRLPHAALRIHADNLGVFDEILAGRADVMITDAIEARMQQRLRPGLCALHPQRPFEAASKAYLLPKGSSLKPAVDRWLRHELAAGEPSRRLDRWLSYPWSLGPTPAQLLAGLVDERLALMPDVARYKWNRKQAIEDLPREQALLESIKAQAPQYGLDPGRAVAFFAAQIDASKVLQRELFFAWQANGEGEFTTTRDLAADIRPRLDALNPRLLAGLAAFDGKAPRRAFGPLQATATSAAAVEAALAPLLN
jgi:chorismate mutase-like protein